MAEKGQVIPASWTGREHLRTRGQFWTPAWVSGAMVAYVLQPGVHEIFDPAVGPGTFFRAAKQLARERSIEIDLRGCEIDPGVFQEGLEQGLTRADFQHVKIGDFLARPLERLLPAIVANPPYIRHHRMSPEQKVFLKALSKSILGWSIDGRAGIHVYFLLRALDLLQPGGRLAFIVPADTCEGIFASRLWQWILAKYRLDAVITFARGASPFPRVDTNPVIICIQNAALKTTFRWARCNVEGTAALEQWVRDDFGTTRELADLTVHERTVTESLETGLSREPVLVARSKHSLSDFARVTRGIATGSNEFFFLTREQAAHLEIPREFLLPAVGRTRDVQGDILTSDQVDALDARGRPTLLLSLDGRPVASFPEPVRDYILKGEKMGLPAKPLISTRNPWYKMETRAPPPLLFAYLGRRNCRFISNQAGVLPLTGFLAIYPLHDADKLWHVLNDPRVIANLALVGKSYGDGAVKVEPRGLDRLSIPDELAKTLGSPRPRNPVASDHGRALSLRDLYARGRNDI